MSNFKKINEYLVRSQELKNELLVVREQLEDVADDSVDELAATAEELLYEYAELGQKFDITANACRYVNSIDLFMAKATIYVMMEILRCAYDDQMPKKELRAMIEKFFLDDLK